MVVCCVVCECVLALAVLCIHSIIVVFRGENGVLFSCGSRRERVRRSAVNVESGILLGAASCVSDLDVVVVIVLMCVWIIAVSS